MTRQDAMNEISKALERHYKELMDIIASIDETPSPSEAPEFMTYQQAAAYMGISVTSLYQKKAHGKVDFEIVGSRVLFRRSVLDELIKNNPIMSESRLLDALNRIKGGVI